MPLFEKHHSVGCIILYLTIFIKSRVRTHSRFIPNVFSGSSMIPFLYTTHPRYSFFPLHSRIRKRPTTVLLEQNKHVGSVIFEQMNNFSHPNPPLSFLPSSGCFREHSSLHVSTLLNFRRTRFSVSSFRSERFLMKTTSIKLSLLACYSSWLGSRKENREKLIVSGNRGSGLFAALERALIAVRRSYQWLEESPWLIEYFMHIHSQTIFWKVLEVTVTAIFQLTCRKKYSLAKFFYLSTRIYVMADI